MSSRIASLYQQEAGYAAVRPTSGSVFLRLAHSPHVGSTIAFAELDLGDALKLRDELDSCLRIAGAAATATIGNVVPEWVSQALRPAV